MKSQTWIGPALATNSDLNQVSVLIMVMYMPLSTHAKSAGVLPFERWSEASKSPYRYFAVDVYSRRLHDLRSGKPKGHG